MHQYANPGALVSTEWVAQHLDDPDVRIVECDEDVSLYCNGHIPGAVSMYWIVDLADTTMRDYIDEQQFARLMSAKGIRNDTKVVFYGDTYNWWATYALWLFYLFGHTNTALMDGGRGKWIAEGRPLSLEKTDYPPTTYRPMPRDDTRARIFQENVLKHLGDSEVIIIDSRSPEEYAGGSDLPCSTSNMMTMRSGHIPNAINIPWNLTIREDGTFKSREELEALYQSHHVTRDKDIIVYCRLGERSSHTWFVLHQLLGYESVRNYDGGWLEWGSMVRIPIEKTCRDTDIPKHPNETL